MKIDCLQFSFGLMARPELHYIIGSNCLCVSMWVCVQACPELFGSGNWPTPREWKKGIKTSMSLRRVIDLYYITIHFKWLLELGTSRKKNGKAASALGLSQAASNHGFFYFYSIVNVTSLWNGWIVPMDPSVHVCVETLETGAHFLVWWCREWHQRTNQT